MRALLKNISSNGGTLEYCWQDEDLSTRDKCSYCGDEKVRFRTIFSSLSKRNEINYLLVVPVFFVRNQKSMTVIVVTLRFFILLGSAFFKVLLVVLC